LGRPNIANESGWINSRLTQNPPPCGDDPIAYDVGTPNNIEYTNKTSVTTTKVGDILPSDRAVPNMAAYKGFLYAARNTSEGPQLWRCVPIGVNCDTTDWALVAPNTTGDQELSQFNNTGNTSITLLEATDTHLYVGFDNGAGVVLYRSDAAAPTSMGDFVGDGGCVAGPGCAGLGGAGFGRSENKQFLDSETIDIGGGVLFVYALVGDTIAPLNFYRFLDP
jgi:hypothetical protein